MKRTPDCFLLFKHDDKAATVKKCKKSLVCPFVKPGQTTTINNQVDLALADLRLLDSAFHGLSI